MFQQIKKIKGIMTALILACVCFLCIPLETLAATKPINGVSVRVSSKIKAGDSQPGISIGGQSASDGEVQISTSGSYYTVSDAEWVDKVSRSMTTADAPRIKVVLTPTDVNDHYFLASYKASSVNISGGSFVSARRDGDDLVVTLRLNPIKGKYDEPKDAYWNENNLGEARWEAGENDSKNYEVQLYRNGKSVFKVDRTSSRNYNFYPYMTTAGEYTFKVRTIPGTDDKSKYGSKSGWTESGELQITDRYVSDGKGRQSSNSTVKQGTQDTVGWFKDGNVWKYRYPNGNLCSNGWAEIDGLWYYFDGNASMLTGWQTIGNGIYYLQPDGSMTVGWGRVDGKWYYFRPEAEGNLPKGSMVSSGWRIIGAYYYYFNQDGSVYTGWLQQNGKWYYLNELDNSLQGAMFTGWFMRNEKTYFADANGELINGWYEIDGRWYYFYPGSGEMAHDTEIDGLYVNSEGVWQ